MPEPSDSDMMELILSTFNLESAWRKVKRNRGAPGPDGMTISEFEPWAETHWEEVRQQLLDGSYRPDPVRRKVIAKENGGELNGVLSSGSRVLWGWFGDQTTVFAKRNLAIMDGCLSIVSDKKHIH